MTKRLTLKDLENYKFDNSKYVVINDGIKRDPVTGSLKMEEKMDTKHKKGL